MTITRNLASSEGNVQGFKHTHTAEEFGDNHDTGNKNSEEFKLVHQLDLGQLVGVHEEARLLGRGRTRTCRLLILSFLDVPHIPHIRT